MKTQVFYSHGKLLLTAEYVVLDGATALAIPTKKGQYLSVTSIKKPTIVWQSFDENGKIWFKTSFDTSLTSNKTHTQEEQTLLNILRTAQKLNPNFLNNGNGYLANTRLTFNRKFGLGSSSTLIANIAKWAKVNPFELLQQSFGGSGYDIACANSNGALTFKLDNGHPIVNSVHFNPNFKEHIYFIYLNKKQDSKEGISYYKNLNPTHKQEEIKAINSITQQLISCTVLSRFNDLINQHENILSKLLKLATVKERLFSNYSKGSIKSLGAWGGDFIMVTVQTPSDLDYFIQKGYTTIFSFEDMIL